MTLDLSLIVGPNTQDRLPIQGEDLGDEDMIVTHTTGNAIIIIVIYVVLYFQGGRVQVWRKGWRLV